RRTGARALSRHRQDGLPRVSTTRLSDADADVSWTAPLAGGGLISGGGLLYCVAPNATGGFFAFDLGKQPHREDHKESEERNNVLDALVSQNVLIVGRDGCHQHDGQRKSQFDFYGHRRNLPLTTTQLRCI